MKSTHFCLPLTLLLAAIVFVLGAATPARAELRRFILEYTNTSNTRAQARGYIVIDDDQAVFANPGLNNFPRRGAFVKELQITVSKATDQTHNGTFDAADFGFGILLDTDGGPIDLTRELVGQAEFSEFNISASNALAPSASAAFEITTGNGSGDVLTLSSFRPVVTTGARVYKCTLALKGSYKYCDRDYFAPGVPQWVCKKYRSKVSYYMAIDSLAGLVGFFWLDPKTRTYDVFFQCALPELKYAQCRPPSASAPAGKWQACLPLWCHREDIDIDLAANPNVIDATRCRIACLTGVESLRTFTFNEFFDPDIRVRLKDHAVARFKGGFCQTTCYDTVHYAFADPNRDKLLRWPFAPIPGLIMGGGGSSCITGTMSCRLDTRLTAVALSREALDGSGYSAAEIAINDDLFAKGWTLLRQAPKGGASLTLQPDGQENLEPLIP